MKLRLGAFYEGKAIWRGRKVLVYPLVFIARRLVLIYLVVDGPDELIYQMIILISSSFLYEWVLYHTEALESRSMMHASTLNELVILQVAYCFLSFDVLEVEGNFEAGFAPIIITGCFVTISLLFIVYKSLLAARLKLLKYCTKRKYLRQREELQGYLSEDH